MIKNMVLLGVLLFLQVCVFGQASNFGGLTIQATSATYLDSGVTKQKPCNELYNISLKDSVMIHNTLINGMIDAAQVYKLSEIGGSIYGDIIILTFTATSGITGMKYMYEIRIASSGELLSLECTEENSNVTIFTGSIIVLKTFSQ